jgi:ATP/maltotriose-dependent transcriptional regulator MalT/DNA-binding SARP family transcriptional activator
MRHRGREGQPGRIPRPKLAGRLRDALDSGDVILTAGGGSGKTTAVELALEEIQTPVAWIGCSDNERAARVLLIRLVDAVAAAVPGASDALAERLNTAGERFDPLVATRELIAESARLLIEPLVLVIDDAEHLDGAAESLRLLGELIRAERTSLHVAVATRRPLDLKVARARAAGRLQEISTAELAFDAEECADLLRERTGIDPEADDVDEVMGATEGWPLGIALAAALAQQRRGDGGVASLDDLSSAPDVRSYLSEELLDSLDPELREAAIDSSVAPVITPGLIGALGLPGDFRDRIERAGMLVRGADGGQGFAYHPLLRELLLERLGAQRTGDERRRLHAAAAAAAAEVGDAIGAIGHWLEAGRWTDAVSAIEREGRTLLRTSPELLSQWMSALPVEVREEPAMRMLEGQLEWGAGQHERAVEPLRDAVAGYRAAADPEREWLARFFLAQAMFSAGRFEEMVGLADGWDGANAPKGQVRVAGVAWYRVVALTALGSREDAERLARRLRRDQETAAEFKHLADLAYMLVALPAGRADAVLSDPDAAIRRLERHDPHGRLAISQTLTALGHLDVGRVEEATIWFERSQLEAERRGLGFVARDARLRRAALLAQRGELADAELELARAGPHQGTGWRSISRHTLDAFDAASRGDAQQAASAADRAMAQVAPGPVCFRTWVALDVAIALAESGAPDRARKVIAEARSALDEQYPGEAGHYHRARLVATEAWLDHRSGDRDAAYDALERSLAEAADNAHELVRAHWRRLRPILWQALADGAIEPSAVLPALERALPGGEALVAFTDHPEPMVRRAALSGALAANHPAVLSRLAELSGDPDEEVASAVAETRERLRRSPPPLRFAVLGGFRVARGGWAIDAGSWGRPMDARLVRLLLVHSGKPIPEDLIFEALWPGRSVPSARRSLHVSVSRARAVLDLPGVEESAIESEGQAYRLNPQRGESDAEAFAAAAEAALGEEGAGRRALLERARSLWGGEPLPEERYSDWATAYREQLIDRYIAVLTALIGLRERLGDHDGAADLARELVDLDPLNEGAHRALMTAYARAGRTGHALRQYLECRRALVEELGTEPADATSRLQARILAGESI